MTAFAFNARGLRLLADLNTDRFLVTGALATALCMAAYLGQWLA